MPKIASTPWELHVLDWYDCHRCSLSEGRRKVCLVRGDPERECDVLFVGEAPGESEDIAGSPFVGPAGQKLDMVIAKALEMYQGTLSMCFTNLVGCFPRKAKQTEDHRPPPEAVYACSPRLIEVMDLTRPRMIVCVGAMAKEYMTKHLRGHIHPGIYLWDIRHPSAVLHMPPDERPDQWSRMALKLHEGFVRFLGDPIPF